MDIAVLGGTFAPPTIAHLMLLRAGMRFTGSQIGVWVPSSASYMRAWRPESMPEKWFADDLHREGMLRALCEAERDQRAYFDEMRRRGGAYTFDTLCALEAEYGGRVTFLMGSDLISTLPGWQPFGGTAEPISNRRGFARGSGRGTGGYPPGPFWDSDHALSGRIRQRQRDRGARPFTRGQMGKGAGIFAPGGVPVSRRTVSQGFLIMPVFRLHAGRRPFSDKSWLIRTGFLQLFALFYMQTEEGWRKHGGASVSQVRSGRHELRGRLGARALPTGRCPNDGRNQGIHRKDARA